MTEYVEAVRAVMYALSQVRVIVAHSLGAIAAVGALAQQEPGIEQLVLLAPPCSLGGVLDRWSPDGLKLSAKVRERTRHELHRRDGVPVTFWDIRTLGSGLRTPVLAIHDPQDAVVPFRDTEAIATALADVEIVPAGGCGHSGILTAPVVRTAIAAFVAKPQAREGSKAQWQ